MRTLAIFITIIIIFLTSFSAANAQFDDGFGDDFGGNRTSTGQSYIGYGEWMEQCTGLSWECDWAWRDPEGDGSNAWRRRV